ncbi:hypothetical protein ACFSKW_54890 [Nonomuraea mangrovi]|uniref:DUF2637 domain-containing protein n=1 Tax=Nonomuraea mangrovi TaxID=2316207 RepID=A0ABW4THD0_9ACTN
MKNDKRHPQDAPARNSKKKLTAAEKLAAAAQAAADVRAYDTNPDVIAYRIERMRARVDRLMWIGIILGLAFTATNVQQFAAGNADPWSIPWCIAWVLDPTVSLILLGTLLGEQIIARHQIEAGGWVRATKWTALALTYLMNTWESYAAKDPAAILLHSVPPIIVFFAAEAITSLKHAITEAVHKAYEAAAVRADTPDSAPVRTAPVRRALIFRTAPRPEAPRTVRLARTFAFVKGMTAEPARTIRRAFTFQPGARTAPVRRAYVFRTPSVPAGQQPVDRDAFVREVTDEILAAAERGDRWGPDYAELTARARRSRSWVEKRVREARTAVFRTDRRTEVAA